MPLAKALVFDVFGTLVDWRGSIARELREVLAPLGRAAEAETLADGWRARYQPAMSAVRDGSAPWRKLDALHRENLDDLLQAQGLHEAVDDITREHLVSAWHRLEAWPDVTPGLARLRRRLMVAPCSNGHIALMAALARRHGWHWDAIVGAELVHDYKPKPAVYRAACEAFDLQPSQVVMVAAHGDDLQAAAACGMRTAFVRRPDEHGPGRGDRGPAGPVDVNVGSLLELADRLGCC